MIALERSLLKYVETFLWIAVARASKFFHLDLCSPALDARWAEDSSSTESVVPNSANSVVLRKLPPRMAPRSRGLDPGTSCTFIDPYCLSVGRFMAAATPLLGRIFGLYENV